MTQFISKLSSKEPPKELYHYTTQAGLLGIFKSRGIWATKIQYLNDTSEFSLALQLAQKFLRDKKTKSSRKSFRDRFLQEIEGIRFTNICVCSFTEKSDSLSQ
jgi:hypothetical protein